MKKSNKVDVVAIVVTYQPELKILGQLLDALIPQVKSIIIVDNGSQADLHAWNDQRKTPAIQLLLLSENKGIAAAHNAGIQFALDNRADYALLMDQDSLPAQDMVEKLIFALLEAEKTTEAKPLAAGPVYVDSRTGTKSFFVIERDGMPTRFYPDLSLINEGFLLDVSYLISSGTLIDLKRLKIVGGMRSNYFIDHVDTEWCFRARDKGYILLGVLDAEMQHFLGDKVSNVWFFGWRHVAYHCPLRDYYIFRNTLLMLHDVNMSVLWRVHFLWRLVQFSSYFLIFSPQRRERFKYMFLGFFHGLRRISGKIDIKTVNCTQVKCSDIKHVNND
jgi:rhamnosyltransferase